MTKKLSLCIPTNGIIEWVFPVLDSIYTVNVDECEYEVIIEDNGTNEEFPKKILDYQRHHSNLKYYRSTSQGFLCQIDCFRHAQGEFIKFVNHRSLFLEGTLEYLLSFEEKFIDSKPVVFFTNGSVKSCACSSFDSFVANLSYWSSWSGGLAFWKKDIELLLNKEKFNATFPHTDILFAIKDAPKYVIDSRKLFSEIKAGHAKKGNYNLFRAFSVEYLAIICDLLREEAISISTFLHIKNELLSFLADLYINFIILRQKASYTFTDYKRYIFASYSKGGFYRKVGWRFIVRICRKMLKKFVVGDRY